MMTIYKGAEYFVISTQGDMIELAPTAHGAGSFIVHKDFVIEWDPTDTTYEQEAGSRYR
jgi:hypothetical protein